MYFIKEFTGLRICLSLFRYSMLPYFPDAPISGHFDFTILHFVVKRKQIRTILSKDLSTSLLSFVLFAVELRFV